MLFMNRPVGSTSTIVADLFFPHQLPMAKEIGGLLLAGFTIPLVLVKLRASDAPGQWAR